MGSLLPLLLAVLVHGLGEAEAVLGPRAPWAVPLLVALPYALAAAARRMGARGRFRAAERLGRLVGASGLLAWAAAVVGLDWVGAVRAWTGADLSSLGWPEPALALSFAPFVPFQLAAIDAEVRAFAPPGPARARARRFQVRMFLAVLAPLGFFTAALVLVGRFRVPRAWFEHVGVASAGLTVALLAVLVALLPVVLRHVWDTRPLPEGPQRALLDEVGARASFRARRLLVWRTGNLMANAAIVGFPPFGRTVLFSDHLLATLSARELANVYGHEIGHARRHHVPIFLAWSGGCFLGADLLVRDVAPVSGWLAAGVAVGAGVTWFLGFGWLSRRFELDADLFALELLRDPGAMASALERVGGRLRDVAGWRHFSVSDRVRFLARAAVDRAFVRRFRRRLHVLAALGVALALGTATLQARELWRAYPTERALAALALGEFGVAGEVAESLPAGDADRADLAALARAGAAVAGPSGSAAPAEAFAEAARDALEAGELDRAWALAEIAVLQGARALDPVAEALYGRRDGDRERELAGRRASPPAWRETLDAALGEPRRRQ